MSGLSGARGARGHLHAAEGIQEGHPVKALEMVVLSESEFETLHHGGLFTTILIHPEVEVYRTADDNIVIHIPGSGMVEIACGVPK